MAYQSHGAASDFIGVSPLFASSKPWRSLTPYVLTRHVKFRGPKDEKGRKMMVDGPKEQIAREVSLRWPAWPSLIWVNMEDTRKPITPMRKGQFGGSRPFDYFTHKHGGWLQWRRSIQFRERV